MRRDEGLPSPANRSLPVKQRAVRRDGLERASGVENPLSPVPGIDTPAGQGSLYLRRGGLITQEGGFQQALAADQGRIENAGRWPGARRRRG